MRHIAEIKVTLNLLVEKFDMMSKNVCQSEDTLIVENNQSPIKGATTISEKWKLI